MKKLLIFLLMCYATHAYTQGLSADYSIGYGTYQLYDIRKLQQSMLNIYGMKETDCFPGYITHSISLGFLTGNSHFGSHFSYLTTGGRLNRADYSGSITVDMIVNGYRIGAFYRHYFEMPFSSFYTYLQLNAGYIFSNLRIEEQVNVYSESIYETTKFKGTGKYLEPTIGVTYRFKDWLHFSLGGGFEADFSGILKSSGEKTNYKARWDGLRIYGGFIFILPDKKSTHE